MAGLVTLSVIEVPLGVQHSMCHSALGLIHDNQPLSCRSWEVTLVSIPTLFLFLFFIFAMAKLYCEYTWKSKVSCFSDIEHQISDQTTSFNIHPRSYADGPDYV